MPHLNALLLLIVALLLPACASLPTAESPIEAAQRRLPSEPPLIVAEGCLYYRNLLNFNHYLKEESRTLATEGARSLLAALKERGIPSQQFAVPLMCASPLPPRANDRSARVAESLDKDNIAPVTALPQAYYDVVRGNPTLQAAYEKLFAACDFEAYREQKMFECPLLGKEQAALLKSRLKTSYVLALSLGGDRASPLHKTSTFAFNLLLGFVSIPGDEATARIRLVNLETGGLVWSSFEAEFDGADPSEQFYEIGEGGRAGYDELVVKKGWEKKLLKTLFARQR